ncbi:MAG: metalloregulator ArsR/SmtB family transcription factor [Phycisphaerae bacterium]
MEPEVLFKAVADRTRQRTLSVLRRNELTVSELVSVLRQPQSTVSRHLKVLRDAGLIRDRRDGNMALYAVPGSANGGRDDHSGLRGRLLEWIGAQPLTPELASRLETVLHERRDMSRRFFDRVGRQWDSLREGSFGSTFHLEAFLALLPREWVVADIGAGTGYLLPTLAKHFARVLAVEPAEAMRHAAVHRIEYHRLDNVLLSGGDLGRLPIAASTVDLSIAILVLHHVPTPRESLRELHRITCAGGRVLIVEQVAHENAPFRDKMQDRWWGFNPETLADMLRSVGFEAVASQRLASVERDEHAPDLFTLTGSKAA